MTKLLDVPVLGQTTGYTCGNTSLAAVTQYLGRPHTPEELARLAHTTTRGTDHAGLVDAAVATGATVFVKSQGTLAELAAFVERGLPPIVGWWSMEPRDAHFRHRWNRRVRRKKDCGHFSVVKGVTPDGVVLMDPQDDDAGETWNDHTLTAKQFREVWYDTDTERYVKVVRWYLVVNYDGRRFAGEVHGGADHPAA